MPSSLMLSISSLFLAQLVIRTYGATPANDMIRRCDDSYFWTSPSWPENITQYCQGILNAFQDIEPEVRSFTGPRHEFLPVGVAQEPFEGGILEPVRTPWKIRNGPCTLVVTPVDSRYAFLLPVGIPPYPYCPPSGILTWHDVYFFAVSLRDLCLQNKQAGIVWLDRMWEPVPRGLAIFFYATDSFLDHVIGPKANGDLILPWMNMTDYNSTSFSSAVKA